MPHTEWFSSEEDAHEYAQQAGLAHYEVVAEPGPLAEMMPLGGQEGIPAMRFAIVPLE